MSGPQEWQAITCEIGYTPDQQLASEEDSIIQELAMAAAQKLDLYKEHKSEYAASRRPVLIEVGPARYLTVGGKGRPGDEAFQKGIGALYAAAFTIKMTSKFAGRDYKVCGLEGLYCCEKPGAEFDPAQLGPLDWKLMIRTPEFIGKKELAAAVATLLKKGKGPEVETVQLESIREGRCVQMLHVGPYAAETATVEQMRAFASEQGLSLAGPHHEIYLSDPRRVAPERLRTILRYPLGKRP